tara:strand:+ start:2731 stop:2991 length:261 start_codon:yes stop_codon:yes gene_type:complete
MNLHEIQNYTARFNISDSEAQRIAEKAETEADFIKIWDSHDEWMDESEELERTIDLAFSKFDRRRTERIEHDALLMDSERVRRGWY